AYSVKGALAGAVVRIDPKDLSVKAWSNVIEDQGFRSLVSVPGTSEIFFTTVSDSGEDAWVMLWDVDKEEVAWQGRPVPGSTLYQGAVLANNGLIYGLAGASRYYAFDPVARETVMTGSLLTTGWKWP